MKSFKIALELPLDSPGWLAPMHLYDANPSNNICLIACESVCKLSQIGLCESCIGLITGEMVRSKHCIRRKTLNWRCLTIPLAYAASHHADQVLEQSRLGIRNSDGAMTHGFEQLVASTKKELGHVYPACVSLFLL